MCEKDMDMSLVKYKRFLDEQVLVVMGQMDSASEILDYLYLVSCCCCKIFTNLEGIAQWQFNFYVTTNHSFSSLIIHSFIHSLIYLLTHPFTLLSMHKHMHTSMRPIIHLYIHSFNLNSSGIRMERNRLGVDERDGHRIHFEHHTRGGQLLPV